MAKDSLKTLEAQIKRLQDKASSLRNKKRQPAIVAIVRSMKEFDITFDEIKLAQTKGGSSAAGKSKKASTKSVKKVPAKYRNPQTGEEWTGRGKAPTWITNALNNGGSRDQFLIPTEENTSAG